MRHPCLICKSFSTYVMGWPVAACVESPILLMMYSRKLFLWVFGNLERLR
jgi:hypothetical protein